MIVAGFGFRAGASAASLQDALALAAQGQSVGLLATLEDKAATVVFQAFARAQALPVRAVPAEAIAGVVTHTQSKAVRAARGIGSMAEAAALVAAGPGAALLGARVVSGDRMATCALAEGSGR